MEDLTLPLIVMVAGIVWIVGEIRADLAYERGRADALEELKTEALAHLRHAPPDASKEARSGAWRVVCALFAREG